MFPIAWYYKTQIQSSFIHLLIQQNLLCPYYVPTTLMGKLIPAVSVCEEGKKTRKHINMNYIISLSDKFSEDNKP